MIDKTFEELEEERLADHNKRNEEVIAAHAKCRPTPTLEEVRLVLEGKGLGVHEHDGSPEQHVHAKPVKLDEPVKVTKAAEAEVHHDGAYKTRQFKKEKE